MDALALREIHLPAEPGLWPLAWGWWLLLGVGLLFGWLIRRHRQQRPFRVAAKSLHQIVFNSASDLHVKRASLSVWLRQVAILSAGREQVASLTGQAWLEYLNHGLPDQPFTDGIGRLLSHAYSADVVTEWDDAAVYALCQRWLKQQAKRGVADV